MKTTILSWLLVVGFLSAKAADPKDFTEVVSDLAKQIQASNASGKVQRLAIVSFVSTKKQSDDKNEFGEYITESLISSVSSGKKFKLFERKRLDAVLRENELMLSDLMSAEQAQKVGELVPIDVIFSGTYTKLKNYIDVNGRLIDVVSGEIYFSFSGRIKMTADLESLFPSESTATPAQPAGLSALERCKQQAKAVRTKLNDLSTPEKIQSVVKDATAIAFDRDCGSVHYDVMYYFTRFQVDDEAYQKFLLKTLDTIAYPDQDDRAKEIIRYFAKDSAVSEIEWQAGLKAMKRMGNYVLYISLDKIFPMRITIDQELYESRIDEFCRLAQNNQVGLPKPITFTQAFSQLADGFKSKHVLLAYAYERYGRFLDETEAANKKTYGLLTGLYRDARPPEIKRKALTWLADFFNASKASDKSSDQLFDFTRSFQMTTNKETNKDILKNYPPTDLEFFISKCRDKISEYAPLTKYNSQKEDRIDFCLENDIPIPGLIPTIDEARAILDGPDWEEQVRVMKMMEKMKERPKPLESQLVKMLDKRNVEHKDELKKMQTSALIVLGNIRSAQPKALEYMIASLMSYDYGGSDRAQAALIRIGKPAVPILIEKFNALTDQDGGLMYKIAEIFSAIGKDAAAARPALQQALGKTRNKDVRYAIESALQAFE